MLFMTFNCRRLKGNSRHSTLQNDFNFLLVISTLRENIQKWDTLELTGLSSANTI